jgi:predicted short-subunit dehydrogenase-like oxidoreductase (DUF2520 family)
MRELEREDDLLDVARLRCAIVGAGRLGRALASALREAGIPTTGPLGRDAADGVADAGVVLLCVPDSAIADAAAAVERCPGRLVAHCSGATSLDALAPHEGFSLHPLMSVPADGPARLAGASAAIAATSDRALDVARALAHRLGLTPVAVAEEDRVAYHAAASIASNFLVTLEAAAERLAETAGVDRAALVPLVRASLENWATLGPDRALTGPIARGDETTVQRQRTAIAERTPDLLPLFDALAEATRALAAQDTDADRAGGAEDARARADRRGHARPEATGPARSPAGAPARSPAGAQA